MNDTYDAIRQMVAGDNYDPANAPWRVPDEKRARYEERQTAWERGYPFEAVNTIGAFACGASLDGTLIGFEFIRENGEVVRTSMPAAYAFRTLLPCLMLAFERAVLRQTEGGGTSVN